MTSNRRQYSAEFKAKVVLQGLSEEKTPRDLCRTHKLHISVLNRWCKESLEQAASIEREDSHHKAEQRIAELDRLVGQLTLQLEIAYPNRMMTVSQLITQIRLELAYYVHQIEAGFVYLAVVMDVFTRSIRGWHLARNMDQSLTLTSLGKGLEQWCPKIHHSGECNMQPMSMSNCYTSTT